jgi:hypothetical protein
MVEMRENSFSWYFGKQIYYPPWNTGCLPEPGVGMALNMALFFFWVISLTNFKVLGWVLVCS